MVNTSTKKNHFLSSLQIFWRRYWHLFVILAFSVLFLLPFWLNRAYIDGHDSEYHLAQILGLSQENIFDMFSTKVIDGIGNGLGYPSGFFYPQLCHIIPAIILKIFAPLGMSVFVASRLAGLLVLFLSGVIMYKLIFVIKSNQKAAILSSILYMGATYHLSDILIRDAQSESLVFLFIPIVALSLYYLAKQRYRTFLPLFVIGVVGLISSHLVLTMWIALFFLIFIILNWRKFINVKNLLFVSLGVVTSLALTAYFWLPLLQGMSLGIYTAFIDNFMFAKHSFNPVSFYSYFDLNVNLDGIIWTLNVVAIAFLVYAFVKNPSLKKNPLIRSLIILVAIAIITMSIIKMNWIPEPIGNIVKMIQFPWRINTVLCFLFVFLVGIVYADTKQSTNSKLWFYFMLICTIVGASAVWNNVNTDPNLTLESVRSNTAVFMDYLPRKSYDNRDYIEQRSSTEILVVSNENSAKISNATFNFPSLSFTIDIEDGEVATIELPRFYALGYQIQAIHNDGTTQELSYIENKYGLIQFEIDTSCNINVSHVGTKTQQVATMVSLISLVTFTVGYVTIIFKDNSKKEPKNSE